MKTKNDWEAWKSYIYTASHILTGADVELKQAAGISLSDFDVLVTVESAPDKTLSMSCLRATVLVTTSGLSRSVSRLKERGWITKTVDQADKRHMHVTLTEAGQEALNQIRPIHTKYVREAFFGALDDEDQATLGRVLSQLERHLTASEPNRKD
ncbi:MarR family winged helix-turn-helix transcriptional regulator [Boudabousia marimammalium]|uniref:HTH marR-type domain-containing protein n=1 Tax=Boudabousia marimammalium TaxID=156892 RepID=A0A1Q5PS80_9ACTO|nr:MarR family winged helix-turn-helix transcriptional regulator [Boudabousia marimammalium]OKL50444.1 hypothetical protein BM477_00245 [Boudabousia marimammalium]